MAQRNESKPRQCNKCEQQIVTTAAGIKTHAAQCSGKVTQ